jgi:hypothetical protein
MISLILVAIATATVFAYTAVYLVRVVRDDGARQTRRTPPRSHHADLFEVPSRFA